ncbi:class I SAM-dependent methyltransferase [Streptomyces sp. WAC05374]|uniref:class I SAM-dependent methyltransferase n=1 Tax=Streptomyces sp. WAC05374 TaxID=2487420 RepID=UPI000F87EB8F|nr:class I SAM-dependent methyltransferase [Streptomyces sp. WAC05374]RST13618.1 class I SAM-dependent methyltransferase [Streptomyces sp. WAC05374]TDF50486.1 class I SAM-dependent methyltransferase [Streptomyces sp. WAC05374]TDF51854.1 class I SAM-dependent methyltransferase [Streptomyces sp. WAC05374]TDF60740.1 class I SAM-dependent methyltransferase [Streptomyces sp. WAC05374]
MFAPDGPTFRELAAQVLSSTRTGYDLLAPKFDRTPYRTSDSVLEAVAGALRPLGPFGSGLDVCCGTGAGVGVLRELCRERVTGVDFSAGMLARARAAHPPVPGEPAPDWVRADARALPFRSAFDLAVSFGAFGHFLPAERPRLFAGVHRALRPGGRFVFPLPAPPPVGSLPYWELWAFDAAMRLRNLLWRPPFIMYYRTMRLTDVVAELTRTGFTVELTPLEEFGRRPGGAPWCRLVTALRP